MYINDIITDISNLISSGDLTGARQVLRNISTAQKNDQKLADQLARLHLLFPDPATAFRLLQDHYHLANSSTITLAAAANFLGASRYALKLIEKIPSETKRDRPIETAQILSTNGRNEESLLFFANVGTAKKPKPPQDSRCLLFRCYPLIRLNRFDETNAIADFFLNQSKASTVIRAFALIFKAWAQAKRGDFDKAEKCLSQYRKLDQLVWQSWTAGLYYLVAGIYFIESRQPDLAVDLLNTAIKKLLRRGLQPETGWLEALFQLGKAKRLIEGGDVMPEEWLRLIAFPGATNHYKEAVEMETNFESSSLPFLTCRSTRRRIPNCYISTDDDTFYHKDRRSIIRGPTRLLQYLIGAGRHGLPMFRSFDILWPNDPLALEQHRSRLEQYVVKLRNKGHIISWKNNHLVLTSSKCSLKLCTTQEENAFVPMDLRNMNAFRTCHVAELFGVSTRTANRIYKTWIDQGKVTKGKVTIRKVTKGKVSKGSPDTYQAKTLINLG